MALFAVRVSRPRREAPNDLRATTVALSASSQAVAEADAARLCGPDNLVLSVAPASTDEQDLDVITEDCRHALDGEASLIPAPKAEGKSDAAPSGE